MLDGFVISLCLVVLRQGGRTFALAFWWSLPESALACPVRSKGPPPLERRLCCRSRPSAFPPTLRVPVRVPDRTGVRYFEADIQRLSRSAFLSRWLRARGPIFCRRKSNRPSDHRARALHALDLLWPWCPDRSFFPVYYFPITCAHPTPSVFLPRPARDRLV